MSPCLTFVVHAVRWCCAKRQHTPSVFAATSRLYIHSYATPEPSSVLLITLYATHSSLLDAAVHFLRSTEAHSAAPSHFTPSLAIPFHAHFSTPAATLPRSTVFAVIAEIMLTGSAALPHVMNVMLNDLSFLPEVDRCVVHVLVCFLVVLLMLRAAHFVTAATSVTSDVVHVGPVPVHC